MNLTKRFSLTHGAIALLAVTVTLGVMIGGAHLLFWNEVRQSQKRQIGDFALQARESYFGHEDVGNCNFIRQAARDETVAFVAYVDASGMLRLVLPTTYKDENLINGEQTLTDGRVVEIISLAVDAGGKKIGTVGIAYDTAKVEKRVLALMVRWVGLGAVGGASAFLVALLVSVLLARQLASPLKRIRAGTQEVRSGKLDKLVDVKRSDEIGDLARDFNDMVAKLKELEAMKRDFISGVTHDFGTPLHAIKNASEMMQEGMAGPLTDRQAEYLLMISNSTIRLTAFVNDLLTSAKIEAAKSEPFYEEVDVLALAHEVVNLYRPQAQKQGLELLVLNAASSPRMFTDAVMLRQIMTNLFSNAMKYTLKGSIGLFLSEEGKDFVVKVKDTGVGIDPKHCELIFDKFFRVRQPKGFPERQGSGLGLSIVKGLAEGMGGSVSVESQPGEGTTFTVKLPKRSESPTGG